MIRMMYVLCIHYTTYKLYERVLTLQGHSKLSLAKCAFSDEMAMRFTAEFNDTLRFKVLSVLLLDLLGSLLLRQQPLVPSRHCGHRPPEPRSPRRKRQIGFADGERRREPQAEHRACTRDRRLHLYSAVRPSQRPIGR